MVAECEACGFAGDAIDLAAGWWVCTREEARQRLHPDLVKSATKSEPTTVEEIWHKAQEATALAIPRDVISIINCLAYNRPIVDEYCERYGWIAASAVYQLIHRPLRIPKAKHYVVVPSWITPSRLAGVYLVSIREGEIVRDFLPCNKDNPDSGLTGLSEAMQTRSEMVFACFEPLVAPRVSKIQQRYTHDNVPFVGCHWDDQSRTLLAWQSLTGKKIVLWGTTLSWQIISTAAMIDGYVAIKGPDDDSYHSVSKYVVRREPAEWLHWLAGRVRPWHEMLNRWLPNRAKREEVTGMIQHMLDNGFDPNIVTGQLRGRARFKWQTCVNNYANLSRTQMVWLTSPKVRILKTRSGWHAQVGNDVVPVLNADLQIDYVFAREGVAWFRGKLVCADVTVPFEAKASDVEGDTWTWLRNLSAVFQVHVEFSSRYRSRLFEIATLFHRPRPVKYEELSAFNPEVSRRSKHDSWVNRESTPPVAQAAQPATISGFVEERGDEDDTDDRSDPE